MAATTENREETFYVRVLLTGPPDKLARAARYAKENVQRATESLKDSLGVDSSVSVYSAPNSQGEYARMQSTLYGSTEEPPLGLEVKEID